MKKAKKKLHGLTKDILNKAKLNQLADNGINHVNKQVNKIINNKLQDFIIDIKNNDFDIRVISVNYKDINQSRLHYLLRLELEDMAYRFEEVIDGSLDMFLGLDNFINSEIEAQIKAETEYKILTPWHENNSYSYGSYRFYKVKKTYL